MPTPTNPTPEAGRVFPVAGDDSDPRFTKGLVIEVAALLQRHGYPGPIDMAPADWADLQQALYRFLYVGGEPR